MNPNRRNISILFFSLIVVMLGFGIVIPILPFYIDRFGAGGKELGLLMSSFAIMQFLFAPLWGVLSDRYGRKPILLIGVLGNAIAQFFFGFATQLWMLYAARILAGILSSATLPTAMAYIGDSTRKEDRGGGMGMMGAAMGIGMVLGPGIGGWVAVYGLSMPFFVAGALSLAAMVLIMIILPESLPPEAREKSGEKQNVSPFSGLWEALRGPIGFLLILALLLSFGLTAFEGVFGLYSLKRYGYDAQQVGTILVAIGLTSAVVQMALTGRMTKRWGEAWVIKLSFLGSAIGFVLVLWPDSFLGVTLAACFLIIFNALLRPAVSSLISIRAPGGQGAAMGLNNAFMSLGRIFGPLWAGALFDFNIHFPYISGGIIMLMGFAASLLWLRKDPPAPAILEESYETH